jgi:hypothetical protein
MRMTTSGTRPHGEAELKSERLQLNDFIFEDWSLVEAPTGQLKKEKSEEEEERSVSAEEVEALLTPEVMRRFDGKVGLNVQQILLGEEKLGSGTAGTGGLVPSLSPVGLAKVGNTAFQLVGDDLVGGTAAVS